MALLEEEARTDPHYDRENVGFDYERLRMISVLHERSDWEMYRFTIYGTRFMEVAVPDTYSGESRSASHR